jgi:hypothetical protein
MKKPAHRKPAYARKEHSIRVRLTKEQIEAIQAAADREHMDISAWARRALLVAAESETHKD